MEYTEKILFKTEEGRESCDAADIIRLFDDAADRACRLAGAGKETLMERGLLWVKAREFIRTERLPHDGEELTVTTDTLKSAHFVYPRVTEVRDSFGRTVAKGDCQWVIVGAESRSLAKPSECDYVQEGPRRRTLCSARFAEAAEIGTESLQKFNIPLPASFEFTVSSGYTDFNGHMNNRRYVRLCTDWLRSVSASGAKADPSGLAGSGNSTCLEIITGLELLVEYRKETFPGDRVAVSISPLADGGLNFEGKKDDESIFRLQLARKSQPEKA